MVTSLVMLVTVSAMVGTHLLTVVGEQKNIEMLYRARRATAMAQGELELAKNIVNASSYTGNQNDAIQAALGATPPVITGTQVFVSEVPSSNTMWYRLRALGTDGQVTKIAQIFVRERSPVSAYNFFVVDHPLGISGAPRGSIHSNKTIDFYFPYGLYRDQVTAAEGFTFKAGATPENTRLQGQWDASAPTSDILEGKSIAALADKADTLKVLDDLFAEVEFKGKDTEVKLFSPETVISVEKTGTRSVFDHFVPTPYDYWFKVYNTVQYEDQEPVYERVSYVYDWNEKIYNYVDVTKVREDPIYQQVTEVYYESVPVWDTRTVTKEVVEQVWVEDPPPNLEEIEGGFAVGGAAPELGHWESKSRLETVEETYIKSYDSVERTRTVNKQVGTTSVSYVETEKVFSHWEPRSETRYRDEIVSYSTVTKSKEVFSHWDKEVRYFDDPVYRDEEYTYFEDETVPAELARTENVKTEGVIYIEGEISSVKGQVNGQVSLVTNSKAVVTDSITYVDDNGNTRMLNGTDPTAKYEFNRDYTGDSILGIMSDGDINYALSIPEKVEINASLISLNGKVAFEGVEVSPDGKTVTVNMKNGIDPADYIKESIRRLGGIVARHRPVTTYVDESNKVLAGFGKGTSIMDRNLILDGGGNAAPPFVFQANQPTWSLNSVGKVFDTH